MFSFIQINNLIECRKRYISDNRSLEHLKQIINKLKEEMSTCRNIFSKLRDTLKLFCADANKMKQIEHDEVKFNCMLILQETTRKTFMFISCIDNYDYHQELDYNDYRAECLDDAVFQLKQRISERSDRKYRELRQKWRLLDMDVRLLIEQERINLAWQVE